MTIYSPNLLMKEARDIYFARSGFGENGGYDDRWIKVKVWRIPVWLPNVENRRRAVKLHDLHHIVTEYPTTWRGEAEISAWELGSGGLGSYWAGWILDLMNMAQGLVINPRGVYQAFMRGRNCRNLFDIEFTEELLDCLVGDLRAQLKFDKPVRPVSNADKTAFVVWAALGVVVYAVAVLLPVVPIFVLAALMLFR